MGAIIRFTKTHVLILCPLGHYLESTPLDKYFAGSMTEAEIAFHEPGDRFDRMADACKGYGHKEAV